MKQLQGPVVQREGPAAQDQTERQGQGKQQPHDIEHGNGGSEGGESGGLPDPVYRPEDSDMGLGTGSIYLNLSLRLLWIKLGMARQRKL